MTPTASAASALSPHHGLSALDHWSGPRELCAPTPGFLLADLRKCNDYIQLITVYVLVPSCTSLCSDLSLHMLELWPAQGPAKDARSTCSSASLDLACGVGYFANCRCQPKLCANVCNHFESCVLMILILTI